MFWYDITFAKYLSEVVVRIISMMFVLDVFVAVIALYARSRHITVQRWRFFFFVNYETVFSSCRSRFGAADNHALKRRFLFVSGRKKGPLSSFRKNRRFVRRFNYKSRVHDSPNNPQEAAVIKRPLYALQWLWYLPIHVYRVTILNACRCVIWICTHASIRLDLSGYWFCGKG